MESRSCLNCLKDFPFKPSQLNHYKGAGRFCTRACHYEYYRNNQEKRSNFKKDKYDPMGYRLYLKKGGEVVREHRWIMEQHLGRKLLTSEHVHHINGKKADNRLENLIVLTASEHHKDHANDPRCVEGLKKAQKESIKRWKTWKKQGLWSFNWDSCLICKGKDFKHQGHGKCSRCYLKEYGKRELKHMAQAPYDNQPIAESSNEPQG